MGVVRLKRDGTSLREKAGFKGETGEWSGYPANEKRETGHSLHSVTTMLLLRCVHFAC
jgi:hypothetical protein